MRKMQTERKPRRILKWIMWVLIVQLVLINISAAFYAYRLTRFYQDTEIREPATNQNIFVRTWRLFTGPHYNKSVVQGSPTFAYDTVMLKTSKGIFLDAWYAATDSISKGTVILFHGITTTKASLLAEANEFRYQGYNILMVDFRAHGNSGGNVTTMGIREAEDVQLAYDHIKSKGEQHIFLYGSSMGAVTVLNAVSTGYIHPNGIILEMPFASMQSHLQARARLEGFSGFVEKPFGFLVTAWIGAERGCNSFGHRSAKYAAKITCPVLLQWGVLDRIVKEKEITGIYDALASSEKKLEMYAQAGHGSLLQSDPSKWQKTVSLFLSENRK